uniref:DDE Tnp4 domain-containing protein n=1 Tax=Davidia involucrata TaxID=16924 RepID=A0A5B6Z4Z9_DAVIN
MDNIKPQCGHAPFSEYLKSNPQKWPNFRNCIGAIDGTHVKANLQIDKKIPYIGIKGYPTQNIMTAYDWNMCFTFAWPGWEGSAHDSRIFNLAIQDPDIKFPKSVGEEFYLVDAGYPNTTGYLCPYKEERYHLPDFRRGSQPRNLQELFNHTHSSLHSVIERTFGVWKARWLILANMP